MVKSAAKEPQVDRNTQEAARSQAAPTPASLTLRQARILRLMSANDLGRRAGVAASTVLHIEQGAIPRLATIAKLASALAMDPHLIAWPGDPLGDVTPGEYSYD